MAVVGEPMEKFVLEQIQNRQKFAGKLDRDNKHQLFTTSRTAWIKLASGVKLVTGSKYGGGLTYPKNYVLFNGTSREGGGLRKGIGPEQSYDTSDKNYGVVPMPGIISAQITAINRGSVKKATIKIKANSKRQFEIIDELYLRIGYTMILEWGWTHYLTSADNYNLMGPTIIDKSWFQNEDNPGPTSSWLKKIIDERKLKKGNYDAMFGKVVNFTWDFNDDGTYDIELKLISHGDIIESLRTLPSDAGAAQFKSNEDKNCFEIYFEGKGINMLKFSKTNPIVVDNSIKASYNNDIIGADAFILDTSNIRDKLTEYLFAVSMFGFGVYSHVATATFISDISGESQIYPFQIDAFKPNGYEEVIYDKSSTEGLGSRVINSGYREKRQMTQVGVSGFFSYSPEVSTLAKTKKKIIESIVIFDGGFNPIKNKEFDKSSFTSMNRIYNPLNDPNQRSYIRLGHLLKALQTLSIPIEESSGEPIVLIETNESIPLYIPPGENGYQEFNQTKVQSLKPETVILSNYNLNFRDAAYGMDSAVNANLQAFSGDLEISIGQYSTPTSEEDSGTHISYIMGENIYISIPYIISLMPISKNDSNETRLNLYSFLKDLCQEINVSLGAVNNLEPIVNENTNTIHLQDSTNFPFRKELYKSLGLSLYKSPDLPDESKYQPIQVYGYRRVGGSPAASFVRKIDLQTKLSKELSTIAQIGATAGGGSPTTDATALSRFNVGKIDRFSKKYGFNQTEEVITPKTWKEKLNNLLYVNNDSITNNPDCSNLLGYQQGSMNTNLFGGGDDFSQSSKGLTMDSSIQSSNQNFFQQYYRYTSHLEYKNKEAGSPQIGFLPFEFSLDMDGMSGVKIYNKINVDSSFLPSNYPKALEFVIKGVEHSLKDNDWVTKLVTIAVPKTSDIKIKISSGINLDTEDSTPSGESSPDPTSEKCDCGCEGPGGAQSMIGTWNNSKKKKLINYSGTEIWPIMGWDNQKVFWEGGKPYALPKPGRKAKRNKYKKNPQYVTLLTSWSHQGRSFNMLNIKSPVTGLTLQQSINKTLDVIKSNGLLNTTYAFIDGNNVVSRDVGGTNKTKLCKNRGRLSGHAFAIALDVNSGAYPMGSTGTNKWKNFKKWFSEGDIAAGASLTTEEKNKGKVINIFATISHGGNKIWTQGISFGDPHHFTLNGWIM